MGGGKENGGGGGYGDDVSATQAGEEVLEAKQGAAWGTSPLVRQHFGSLSFCLAFFSLLPSIRLLFLFVHPLFWSANSPGC
jgi:hypothetical protein